MELNKEDKAQIKQAIEQYPAVKKIWEALEIYTADPSKDFYKEVVLTVQHLSKELALVRSGKKTEAVLLNSEDRLFERVKDLLVNAEKIFGGLDRGKGQGVGTEAQTQRFVL